MGSAVMPFMQYVPATIIRNAAPTLRQYAQGAAYGLSGARQLYRFYSGVKKRRTATGASQIVARGGGGGRAVEAGYAGRFRNLKRKKRAIRTRKRPKRKPVKRTRRRYVKGENYYGKYGAINTTEINGSVSDTDCVYLGHSSFAPGVMLSMIAYAIIRRLFKMGIGYESDNLEDVIPYISGAVEASNGCVVEIRQINLDTGVKSRITHTLGASETLASVGNWLKLNVLEFASSESTNNPVNDTERNNRLLSIQLTDLSTNTVKAHMDLTTLKVSAFAKSTLKMQNVTIPTAGADETDNVANTPLQGRQYHFAHWQPATADTDMVVLNRVNQDTGVLAVEIKKSGVGGLPAKYNTWKEPPPSKAFVNCSKSVPTRIEPGTIKEHTSITRVNMSLERMLRAICLRRGNVNNRSVKLGQHEIFAWERMIQMSGDLPLKVNYECNIFTGVAVTHRPANAIMQTFGSVTQSPTLIPIE